MKSGQIIIFPFHQPRLPWKKGVPNSYPKTPSFPEIGPPWTLTRSTRRSQQIYPLWIVDCYYWAIYYKSFTWFKAIFGGIPLLFHHHLKGDQPAEVGRYKLPQIVMFFFVGKYIYHWIVTQNAGNANFPGKKKQTNLDLPTPRNQFFEKKSFALSPPWCSEHEARPIRWL